ncbi:MAG: tyrosine-type recombinase/integrase [Butyricicoccus sp.]
MHPSTVTGWFHTFIERSDLPPISIHSLRHTNATLLIAAGTSLTTVAARLGHANSTTTSKIYAHVIQSADAAASAAIGSIVHQK